MQTPSNERDYGSEVDSLIRIRDQAKVDGVRSKMELLEMGVKTIKVAEGKLHHLPGLNTRLYEEWNQQEFSWEAESKEGPIMKQFQGSRQHHYGNIDQSKLKSFSWVSCFDWPTDNQEKRVIVSLDFESGVLNIMNGIASPEVRSLMSAGYPKGKDFKPRLVMKMVKRVSTSLSYPDGATDEISMYNRYIIGWENMPECQEKAKRLFVLEPNGVFHIWNDK